MKQADLGMSVPAGDLFGQNLRSKEVTEMLNRIALRHPLLKLLKTDNGSESAARMKPNITDYEWNTYGERVI